MQQTNTKSLVEGALLSAITIILSLAALYVPVIGVFASLVWPVPIVILGIRHGLRISILATVVSGIIVAMLEGPTQALTVVLSFGLIGVVMGWAIKHDFSPVKIMLVSGAASLVSRLVLVIMTFAIMGINPLTEEIAAMRESMDYAINLYKGMGINPDTLKSMTESFDNIFNLLSVAIPAMLILGAVLDAFLNYAVVKMVMARLGQKLKDFVPFWQWRMPTYTVFFYLVGVLLVMLEQYWPAGVLRTVGLNLQVIFYFAFIIEGFSLMAYYMGKYMVPRGLRLLIVFMVFFNPFISQIVLWAGMFDILFNFRHI